MLACTHVRFFSSAPFPSQALRGLFEAPLVRCKEIRATDHDATPASPQTVEKRAPLYPRGNRPSLSTAFRTPPSIRRSQKAAHPAKRLKQSHTLHKHLLGLTLVPHKTQEKLPPAPPAPPLEAPWKPPPPGFDARTLRRQASSLRSEAAGAHRDEESVRRSSLHLAEVLRGTVENGKENVSLARERLRCLHAALRQLRGKRARHGEAVEAAVAWQESLEELR